MSQSKHPKKIYRLAVYGLSASGKTCVLAALAMPRHAHPLGHTCTWRPIEMPAAKGQHNQPDGRAISLQRNKEWMEQAIQNLSKGELPPPNPTGEEHFIFHYDFTVATHQTFQIELVDYSGELVNPTLSNSEIAQNLRHRFAEMDGILVLAEAPYRDMLGHHQGSQKTQDKQVHKDLYDLRQSFTLLRGEKQEGAALDVPVALLVNKWDRYSQMNFQNPEHEQRKLEDFLNSNPPPPHRGLRDVLHSSVTEGNFKEFAVSALGPSQFKRLKNGEVVERPLQTIPLQSFGLEDAFIWIAQRRDAVDLQRYQNRALKNLRRCKQEGAELLNRFPSNSQESQQVKAVLWQCQRRKITRWIGASVFIGMALVMGETTVDFIDYRQHTSTANDPQATDEALKRAEDWLLDYGKAPYFRHLVSYRTFLSRDQSQTMLTELQLRRENVLWDSIIKAQATSLQTAIAPAAEYLQYYPYGTHASEVRNIKLRADFQQKQQENEAAFRAVASRVQESQQDPEKLNQLLTELRKLPKHLHAETEDLRNQRIALEQQLSSQVVQQAKQQDWERFIASYQDNMQSGNFLEAAQSLSNRPEEDEQITALKENFRTTVIPYIAEQVTQALKDNRSDDAYQLVKSYGQFPPDLQSGEGRTEMAKLQQQIHGREDQEWYEKAKKYLDVKHFDKYLQYAPLQTMATEVTAYKDYLGKIDPNATVQFQLKLAIEWSNLSGSKIHLRVLWKGETVITDNTLKAKPGSQTGFMRSGPISAKPSDEVNISIKIDDIGFFSDDNYQWSGTEKVSELASGSVWSLQNSNKLVATAHLVLDGYPTPPELPEWRGVR